MKTTFLALALAAVVVTPSSRALDITLPRETAALKESPLPGFPLAQGLCSTCHSAEYAFTQPPASPRAYWQATVVKMQKVFGAPVPDTAIDPIVDYLVKTYGNERDGTVQEAKDRREQDRLSQERAYQQELARKRSGAASAPAPAAATPEKKP